MTSEKFAWVDILRVFWISERTCRLILFFLDSLVTRVMDINTSLELRWVVQVLPTHKLQLV